MNLSVVHDEMEGLLWITSYMRDMKITLIQFETDYSDLVDITSNPMDWQLLQQRSRCFRDYKKILKM